MIARSELHLVAGHASDLAEGRRRNVRVCCVDFGGVQRRLLRLLYADVCRLLLAALRLICRWGVAASGQRRRQHERRSGQKQFVFHGETSFCW